MYTDLTSRCRQFEVFQTLRNSDYPCEANDSTIQYKKALFPHDDDYFWGCLLLQVIAAFLKGLKPVKNEMVWQ